MPDDALAIGTKPYAAAVPFAVNEKTKRRMFVVNSRGGWRKTTITLIRTSYRLNWEKYCIGQIF